MSMKIQNKSSIGTEASVLIYHRKEVLAQVPLSANCEQANMWKIAQASSRGRLNDMRMRI